MTGQPCQSAQAGQTYWHRLVYDEPAGSASALARAGLTCLAWLYRGVITGWTFYQDHLAQPTRAAVPVISIGNIVVGGSGKTPAVIYLADHLQRMSRRVGVLTRGYGGRQRADEVQLLRQHCPNVAVFVDRDRVASSRQAADAGCDVLVLDDGFQHRRLARDLDVVLLDATRPFGMGRMLPRGLLREPLKALRRANVIILTRSDQVDAPTTDAIRRRLAELVPPSTTVLRAVHRPVELVDLSLTNPSPLPPAGGRAVLASAIANPAAFERTVAGLGLQVAAHRIWPDHHRFADEDVAELARLQALHEPNWLLTTEKDAVKWQRLSMPAEFELLALRVSFDLAADDATMLTRRIEQLLSAGERGVHGQELPAD